MFKLFYILLCCFTIFLFILSGFGIYYEYERAFDILTFANMFFCIITFLRFELNKEA